ncbi:hypothetical protein HDU76_008559 [Blyttiomyces sp. JEL0837]|nr:hypothetical protein HDU76_008559 [Blyttiomyces sp. JEL0837]
MQISNLLLLVSAVSVSALPQYLKPCSSTSTTTDQPTPSTTVYMITDIPSTTTSAPNFVDTTSSSTTTTSKSKRIRNSSSTSSSGYVNTYDSMSPPSSRTTKRNRNTSSSSTSTSVSDVYGAMETITDTAMTTTDINQGIDDLLPQPDPQETQSIAADFILPDGQIVPDVQQPDVPVDQTIVQPDVQPAVAADQQPAVETVVVVVEAPPVEAAPVDVPVVDPGMVAVQPTDTIQQQPVMDQQPAPIPQAPIDITQQQQPVVDQQPAPIPQPQIDTTQQQQIQQPQIDTPAQAIPTVQQPTGHPTTCLTCPLQYTGDRNNIQLLHNQIRQTYSLPQLSVSQILTASAQSAINTLTQQSTCGSLNHDINDLRNRGEGENLYLSVGFEESYFMAVDAWNSEGDAYFKFSLGGTVPSLGWSNSVGVEVGHFTQMVWRATTEVGCASGTCVDGNGNRNYVVSCRYKTPGNVFTDAGFVDPFLS